MKYKEIISKRPILNIFLLLILLAPHIDNIRNGQYLYQEFVAIFVLYFLIYLAWAKDLSKLRKRDSSFKYYFYFIIFLPLYATTFMGEIGLSSIFSFLFVYFLIWISWKVVSKLFVWLWDFNTMMGLEGEELEKYATKRAEEKFKEKEKKREKQYEKDAKKREKQYEKERKEESKKELQKLKPLIKRKDGSAIQYLIEKNIEDLGNSEAIGSIEDIDRILRLYIKLLLKKEVSNSDLEILTHYFTWKMPHKEVDTYISSGQMRSELNEEHFITLKKGLPLMINPNNDLLEICANYPDDSAKYLMFILYYKNNPKWCSQGLGLSDSELQLVYKEFSESFTKSQLIKVIENIEIERNQFIETSLQIVNKARKKKKLTYGDYSRDIRAYLDLADAYAVDENIAIRLKGKALLAELLEKEIEDDKDHQDKKWPKSIANEKLKLF